MYSDRVDNVTRATNPFPPSYRVSLHSSPRSPPRSLPPPAPPSLPHLPMHRRIKHGFAVRSNLPSYRLPLSLFLPVPTLVVFRCLVPLSRFPYASHSIFLPLIPHRAYLRAFSCVLFLFLLFRHLTLFHPPQDRIFFFFLLFPLLNMLLRLVFSHLGNRRT